MINLNGKNQGRLPADFSRPGYDRSRVQPAIIHFGVGGFHRAHQAVYTDEVLAAGDLDWGLRGAGITPGDNAMRTDLAGQDFLYSLVARDTHGEERRVVGSILDLIVSGDHPARLVDAMSEERTRIISMTITENGYCYRADTGEIDLSNRAVMDDLQEPGGCRTVYGCLRAALTKIRHEARRPPTILSCDNLPQNGDRLRRLFLEFLSQADPELGKYVENEVSFPNCMVDRITPVTTKEQIESFPSTYGYVDRRPVFSERFRQWVVEDRFPAGRPDWSVAGATFVADVVPFERMKIRLLNGSHSALAYMSYLLGFRKVDDAMADPGVRRFVELYMEEITPTVGAVPGMNLDDYKRSLVERFSNPAISDQVLRLTQDGSKKIPNMILEPVEEILQSAARAPVFAPFALAAWVRFLEGTDEADQDILIDDPRAGELQAAARQTVAAGIQPFLHVPGLFPSHLANDRHFASALEDALEMIRSMGMRRSLSKILERAAT